LNVLDRKNLFHYGGTGRNEQEEFRHFFRLPVLGLAGILKEITVSGMNYEISEV
jgi:hypothetical protein